MAPAGQDPYSNFEGNSIINLMGYTGYPTATVDRSSSLGTYTTWASKVNTQANVPATVSIDIQRSFDQATGQLEATVNMTALEDLTGQFKYNIVLTEDSLVYTQVNNGNCVSGGTNWVHYWVVRSMINGASGEDLNTGSTWSNGDVISKNVSYTVSSNFNYEKCNLVVFVYKQNSPLYLAEVQQAEQYTLIPPDYVVTANQGSPDVIADNTTIADFDVVIHNSGVQNDIYNLDLSFDGPSGWTLEYTDENGTYPMGQTDSVNVSSGDSTTVTVHVNPNGMNGYGLSTLNFTSRIQPSNHGSIKLRNVTTTGINMLVVDANNNEYENYIDSSIQRTYSGSYGIVSRNALMSPGSDLSHYYVVTWSSGTVKPVFYQDEVDQLSTYLDSGGNLLIDGQDIGSDIFKSNGQSQFAQDFYNNYLHADFVADTTTGGFLVSGLAGDPIGDGILFVLGSDVHERSPDEIAAHDADATPIYKYSGSGIKAAGLKIEAANYRAVYSAIGFEQMPSAIRDTVVARSLRWLMENVTVGVDQNSIKTPLTFSLDQNYPNPFNPTTKIKYSIPSAGYTTLKVYNVLGKEVATLVNGEKQSGTYEVQFDASKLASGVYFYKLESNGMVQSKKMVILK